MPDENLGGKFVYIITFLGIFILLVGIMPSQFYLTAPDYEGTSYPSYWTKQDIETFVYYREDNITRQWDPLTLDFNEGAGDGNNRGTANYKFKFYWLPGGGDVNLMTFQHVIWEFGPFWDTDWMSIPEPSTQYWEHDYLGKEDAIERWDSSRNITVVQNVYCEHISVRVWLWDTNTTRNNIGESWDEGTIQIGCGFGFDNSTSVITSWDLVGRLLTFQAPEIHWSLNFIIALPIWAMIAYLAYRLILMAIPFVGG